jgi:hypothetical protein
MKILQPTEWQDAQNEHCAKQALKLKKEIIKQILSNCKTATFSSGKKSELHYRGSAFM